MARAAKMVDIVVAGRMAKMRVTVSEPAKASVLKRTGDVISEAMNKAADAEFNTKPRSKYRKAFNDC